MPKIKPAYFIATNPDISVRFTDLFRKRGVKLERTYQLNTVGNTDFLNMKEQSRLHSL